MSTSTRSTFASNALMLIQVLRCLPTSRQVSLVCAGARGYHSFVEMMKRCDGPSIFILLANMDLLELKDDMDAGRREKSEIVHEEKDAATGDDDGDKEGGDKSTETPNGDGSHHILRIVQADDTHDLSTETEGMRNIIVLSNAEMLGIGLESLESLETLTMDTPYLEELDHSFLSRCSNLHTVNIVSPMLRLEATPRGFLCGCSSLRVFDMTPFVSISEIQYSFCVRCTSLESIDLSRCRALEELSNAFMCGCTALRSVDISAMEYITFPDEFLEDCCSLEELILNPQGRVEELPYAFLCGCAKLKSINLTPFSGLTSISWGFLEDCSSLASLDLTPLSNVQELEDGFLSGCSGLTTLDLSPLSKVDVLPEEFMLGCTGLKVLDLSPLTRLQDVDSSILREFEGRIVLPPHMLT